MSRKQENKIKRNTVSKPRISMKFLYQLLLILFPIPCPAILGYKLDLLIGLSLRKGGILPKQSGDYLMDSFRVNSLIPAFAQIEEELRNLNSSDHWTLAGMIVLSACVALGNLLLIWKMKKLEKKQYETKIGNPV